MSGWTNWRPSVGHSTRSRRSSSTRLDSPGERGRSSRPSLGSAGRRLTAATLRTIRSQPADARGRPSGMSSFPARPRDASSAPRDRARIRPGSEWQIVPAQRDVELISLDPSGQAVPRGDTAPPLAHEPGSDPRSNPSKQAMPTRDTAPPLADEPGTDPRSNPSKQAMPHRDTAALLADGQGSVPVRTLAPARRSQLSRSTSMAMPWPPPTHIVSRPIVRSSVSRSFSSVAMIRAPVMP